MKIDAKFEGKKTCTFKNVIGTLANFHRLNNSDFILESKMAELKKIKIQTTRSTRCSVKTLFYIGNKLIAQLTKLFTHVLQNHCS